MTDDLRFDQFMEQDAAMLPPESAAPITPWRSALRQILWGIALCSFTINALYLQYILPTIGMALLVTGFRSLRLENRALILCYRLALAKMVLGLVSLSLAALSVSDGVQYAVSLLIGGTTLALYIGLWRGMAGVSRAAGAEKPAAPAAGAMAIWYAVLMVLALLNTQGFLPVMVLLLAFAIILVNIARLTRSLADTGYVITAAPIRVPTWVVIWGYIGLALTTLLLTMLLGQRYHMDWQTQTDAPQDTAIRSQLLELGFPQAVLDDLTAEELATLEGTTKVISSASTLYDQEQYRVVTSPTTLGNSTSPQRLYIGREQQPDGSYLYTYHVYDTVVADTIHVAAALDNGRWMILHYMRYGTRQPGRYTENIEIWPVWNYAHNRFAAGEWLSGQVLYRSSDKTLTSPLRELTSGTGTGMFTNQAITGGWTLPRSAEDARVYVMYEAYCLTSDASCRAISTVTFARQTAPVLPGANALELWHQYGRRSVELHQYDLGFDGYAGAEP